MANRASVLIPPVGIAATQRKKDFPPRLRHTRLQIAVGEAIQSPAAERAWNSQRRQYADGTKCRLAALLPQKYGGFDGQGLGG